jgi:hypothetical protein
MASILTNTSAMVALQDLRTINSNLVDTQNQIATGKKISTAKDNSLLFVRRPQKPHQQKERHHRGHEVRIGHFPRAAMVASGYHLLALHDNGRDRFGGHTPPLNHHPTPGLFPAREHQINAARLGTGKAAPNRLGHGQPNIKGIPCAQTQAALARLVQQS